GRAAGGPHHAVHRRPARPDLRVRRPGHQLLFKLHRQGQRRHHPVGRQDRDRRRVAHVRGQNQQPPPRRPGQPGPPPGPPAPAPPAPPPPTPAPPPIRLGPSPSSPSPTGPTRSWPPG